MTPITRWSLSAEFDIDRYMFDVERRLFGLSLVLIAVCTMDPQLAEAKPDHRALCRSAPGWDDAATHPANALFVRSKPKADDQVELRVDVHHWTVDGERVVHEVEHRNE